MHRCIARRGRRRATHLADRSVASRFIARQDKGQRCKRGSIVAGKGACATATTARGTLRIKTLYLANYPAWADAPFQGRIFASKRLPQGTAFAALYARWHSQNTQCLRGTRGPVCPAACGWRPDQNRQSKQNPTPSPSQRPTCFQSRHNNR